MKKLSYLIILLMIGFVATSCNKDDDKEEVVDPNEVVANGSCGDNLEWKLTAGGVLTISGSGKMHIDILALAPWKDYNDKIETVVIEDGCTKIADRAFALCTAMTSATIPNTVTEIGKAAFSNCISLKSITLPNTLKEMGWSVFRGCKSLTSIEIPSTLTYIPMETFTECSALKSVKIPNTTTSIDVAAFAVCTSLESVDIPISVNKINNQAFFDCSSLKDVYVHWAKPLRIEERTFINRTGVFDHILHVPAGTKSKYEAADYWKEFKEIVEED